MLLTSLELLFTGMAFVFFFLGLQILAMQLLEKLVRRFGRPAAERALPEPKASEQDDLALVAAAVAVARFSQEHGGRPWGGNESR